MSKLILCVALTLAVLALAIGNANAAEDPAVHGARKGINAGMNFCRLKLKQAGSAAEVRSAYRACVERTGTSLRALDTALATDLSTEASLLRNGCEAELTQVYVKFRDAL